MSAATTHKSGAGERLMQVKTKIIATVGPACAKPEKLEELVKAGVDVFRLNFAHGSHEWLTQIVGYIREISSRLGRPLGILGDLSGPKIRLNELPSGMLECLSGMRVEFVRVAHSAGRWGRVDASGRKAARGRSRRVRGHPTRNHSESTGD